MVEETMNYTFLLVLAVFLVVTAPIVLFGAHREGKRRREARRVSNVRDAGSARGSDLAPRHDPPTANDLATGSGYHRTLIRRVYRESSWRGRGMILRAYQERELPTNKLSYPEGPDVKLSELLHRAAERSRATPKA
jgi:hypothetical protein